MDKIWTIKENILYFIEKQGISKADFYKKTGISASNFKGVGLKSEIGGDKIIKILSYYPILSSDWLIMRQGTMLKSEVAIQEDSSKIALLERENTILKETNDLLRFKVSTLESIISQAEGKRQAG